MDEFITMFTNAGLTTSGHISQGEIGAFYNCSMMTYVDEITKEKHMQMMILEFMEAIARVSEKILSFP
jgi:hypothetical protein